MNKVNGVSNFDGSKILQEAFMKANHKALITFVTAGDPSPEDTIDYVLEMERGGADIVELGIPFSDPTAEGPVIQQSSHRALSAGMTVEKTFDMIRTLRERSDIPLVIMTYANVVFSYGYERFFESCRRQQIAGLILVDIPFEEKDEVDEVASQYGVALISLIAPTSGERIAGIARNAKGFLYVVSDMGVTGMRQEIATDLSRMITQIRAVTTTPCAIGFGISTPQQAARMREFADGCIVGSAIVSKIGEDPQRAQKELADFVYLLKNGTCQAQNDVL
ncbi:MAG: tryptophan synthase subunit alpha [Clostridium sp.]|jgi:tryptophan synthase alpha chain|nr:tryptophan synthase subunit alpha [Clostridium sp.]